MTPHHTVKGESATFQIFRKLHEKLHAFSMLSRLLIGLRDCKAFDEQIFTYLIDHNLCPAKVSYSREKKVTP